MKRVVATVLIITAVIIVSTVVAVTYKPQTHKPPTYQQKREVVITGMMAAIDQEILEGDYKCCIDPPCTMCFLGHWLWDDGICRCDDMIAKGELDKVCPQCVRGIEEGQCKSTQKENCEI